MRSKTHQKLKKIKKVKNLFKKSKNAKNRVLLLYRAFYAENLKKAKFGLYGRFKSNVQKASKPAFKSVKKLLKNVQIIFKQKRRFCVIFK